MKKKIASLVGLLVALGILAKGSNSILPLVIQRIIYISGKWRGLYVRGYFKEQKKYIS